jgi:hypothetical protein
MDPSDEQSIYRWLLTVDENDERLALDGVTTKARPPEIPKKSCAGRGSQRIRPEEPQGDQPPGTYHSAAVPGLQKSTISN